MSKLVLAPADVAELLVAAGFVGWQVVRMGAIAMAESALDAYAVNVVHNPSSAAHRSIDVGLMQINTMWAAPFYRDVAALLDPAYNVGVARRIFVARRGDADPIAGYNGWTTYRTGAHVRWQQQAIDAARAVGA